MSKQFAMLLVAVMLFHGAWDAAASPPPGECTPEPANPNDGGKECPLGNGRPPVPLPPPSAPEFAMESWLAQIATQFLDRGTTRRGRDGR